MSEVGPKWAQIMALHGLQGTVSHVLKHRTNASCKDKAVNLKKNMLQQGIVPPTFFDKGQSPVMTLLRACRGMLC